MARKLKEFSLSWPIFWLAVGFLIFKAVTILWPSSWWLEVESVIAFDTPEGEEVLMEVERTIHRDFTGEWAVAVRRAENGGWTVWCTANGANWYSKDAALPNPLTLRWWTNGQCETPPPGKYLISTVWTIRGAGGLPDKFVDTTSNVFRVARPDERGLMLAPVDKLEN